VLAVRSAESHLYHPMTKLGARGRDTTCHSTADNPRSTQATIDQLLGRGNIMKVKFSSRLRIAVT
jgi:hypothetical protein